MSCPADRRTSRDASFSADTPRVSYPRTLHPTIGNPASFTAAARLRVLNPIGGRNSSGGCPVMSPTIFCVSFTCSRQYARFRFTPKCS